MVHDKYSLTTTMDKIKLPCSGVSVVLRHFPIDDSLKHSEVIHRKVGNCQKSGPEFSWFWAAKF